MYRYRTPCLIGERLRWQSCAMAKAREERKGIGKNGVVVPRTVRCTLPVLTRPGMTIPKKELNYSRVVAHLLTAIFNTRLLRKQQRGAGTNRPCKESKHFDGDLLPKSPFVENESLLVSRAINIRYDMKVGPRGVGSLGLHGTCSQAAREPSRTK